MHNQQLFLCHFAGGNCHSFQFLYPHLKDFDIIPLELPGRGRRIRENLLTDFDLAATDLYNQLITKLTNNRITIYGHSMGASLALKVVSMLEAKTEIECTLIVSGSHGPTPIKRTLKYNLPEDEFIEELKLLGGIPDEIYADTDMMQIFLPILRADFQLLELSDLNSLPPLKTPVFVIMGDQEKHLDEIDNWQRFSQTRINTKIYSGGHFFIHKNAGKLAADIKTWTNKHFMHTYPSQPFPL
ncbi:thioesterase II family protein [Pedobacter sp. AW31-3R]|uniref:thioesterase II family protein n=1 Tax=Pedobacter sp. AW31-3R TaxID=3445781 RepID=UPI003FA0BF05